MDFSKIKKISFILLILFILLFPFWCVRGLCAESEIVSYEVVNNLTITPNSNFFTYSDTLSVGYIKVESGYIYTITSEYGKKLAFSNSIPAVNETYTFINYLAANESYSFIADDQYLYFDFDTASSVTITRKPVDGMKDGVNSLVDNVGINQIWDIFDISINYIVVVVLVAFGIYIIFRLIRKVSRGKEGL